MQPCLDVMRVILIGRMATVKPPHELVVIDGMGHDLPAAPWPWLASSVAGVIQRREAQVATPAR